MLRKLYVPRSPIVTRNNPYDLVIVADYAGLDRKGDILPDATKQGIKLGGSFVKNHYAREIAWGNTENPGPGAEALDKVKCDLIHKIHHVSSDHVISVVSNNTIQEVLRIRAHRPNVKRILIVCDEPHARRYRRIVRYFYSHATVDVITVRAKWNEGHPSPWQKSTLRWWIMNMGYHMLMLTLGTPRVIKKFEHKTHITTKK